MTDWKWITALIFTSIQTLAYAHDINDRDFSMLFSNCTEYVAFGPMDLATAQASLPEGYVANEIEGSGGLVVRTSACERVSMSGTVSQPALVAHYGINIVSPDGTGDINNYTLAFVTNHRPLARRLNKAGLPAIYSADIAAEDPAILPGAVYISIFGDGLIPYTVTGDVAEPLPPAFPFLANWWYATKSGALKQSTAFPLIAFGPASLTLQTVSASPLGTLINGNTDTNFPWYNVRGIFTEAMMDVSVVP